MLVQLRPGAFKVIIPMHTQLSRGPGPGITMPS